MDRTISKIIYNRSFESLDAGQREVVKKILFIHKTEVQLAKEESYDKGYMSAAIKGIKEDFNLR